MTDITAAAPPKGKLWRFTWDDVHWGYLTFFVAIHALGLAGTFYSVVALFVWEPFYSAFTIETRWVTFAPSRLSIVFAFAYFRLCHRSISLGAHRLIAHASWKVCNKVLEYALAILFAAVLEGTYYWWGGKHKCHHAETDTPNDVHSRLLYGFFHSHFGWLVSKKCLGPPPARYLHSFVKHREKFAVLWWQKRNYWWLAPLMAFGVPIAVSTIWLDPIGGFLIGGCLRLNFQWHMTWAINSVTHPPKGVRNVAWLVYWAVGEGHHKKHHKYPQEWDFGERDPCAADIRFFVRRGWAKVEESKRVAA